MSNPLLDKILSDEASPPPFNHEHSKKNLFSDDSSQRGWYGLLERKEHQFLRLTFVVLAQVLFFVMGAGFYTFPMWLNFIVTDHIDFSREALTSLGAVPFIGLLGLAGAIIIFGNWLKGNKTTMFLNLTAIASVFVTVSWSLLVWIVMKTPQDTNHSNFVIVFIILLLMGTAVGIFFTVWLDKIFPLIKQKHHFVYSALCNMIFALGSIVSLSAKLGMSVNTWLIVMVSVEAVTVGLSFLFVWMFSSEILVHSHDNPPTEVSTKQLISELLLWKRQNGTEALLAKDCQVRSSQFWWLIASFTSVCTLACCFMANLGPLLSADSEDDVDFDSELIVLIWASVGQTVARILIPIVAHKIGGYITKRVLRAHNMSGGGDMEERDSSVGDGSSREQVDNLIQLKVSNATTLPLTFLIGLVFFVFLLALRISDSVSFIVASSVISGAYGSMWVVTNTFPLFFPKYNFAVLLSFFQLFGMVGMIVFIVITSYAFNLDNDGIFIALLCASVVTMVVTIGAWVDRYFTEPKSLNVQ